MKRLQMVSLTGALTLLVIAATATAQSTDTSIRMFADIPEGAWYEHDVQLFLESGYLDTTQERFRPGDSALRSEVIKLLVESNGGPQQPIPQTASFDDVSQREWYYEFIEEAAKRGWLKGDRDCYQQTRPCTARPLDSINRAEAATVIVRVFALPSTETAPVFSDNMDQTQWYFRPIQIAADNCVLLGDADTGRVRPASFVNRAEIVSMIGRALEKRTYNRNTGRCESDPSPSADIDEVTVVNDTKLRVDFTVDLAAVSGDTNGSSHFSLTGSGNISVSSVQRIDADTLDLVLSRPLVHGQTYTLQGTKLRTAAGTTFTDDSIFTLPRSSSSQSSTSSNMSSSSSSSSLSSASSSSSSSTSSSMSSSSSSLSSSSSSSSS